MQKVLKHAAALIALALISHLATGCGGGGGGGGGMLVSTPPPAYQLAIVSGNSQSANAGSPLANPLVVLVTDASQHPVSGQTVTFTVASGGGSVSPQTATTDTSGQAQTTLTLGPQSGANTVTATLAGYPSATATFTETAIGTTVAATPASVDFGNVTTGTSVMQTVTLTNTTLSAVTVSQVTVSGTGLQVTGITTPVTIAPGQTTSFTIIFAPGSVGQVSGSVSITSTALVPITTVPVTGMGVKMHSVDLTWVASTSANVVGYNAYRGTASGGPYNRLNGALIATLGYTDTTVQSGVTYYYVATAVDSAGNESVHSNEAQAVVPFP